MKLSIFIDRNRISLYSSILAHASSPPVSPESRRAGRWRAGAAVLKRSAPQVKRSLSEATKGSERYGRFEKALQKE